ncbi:hypothetical protein ACFFQ5_19175 [Pseudomonas brassicacearum]|uniref:Uncharacterized protein n=1 Tax=Pseudomonas brassicacearum (strain NFM421) TaxID=994484 RepID=F2K7V1_PSEBN|nr:MULTISPECIES: hypothetical protein [Pseudomonas]AEA69772.1 Hypothetical protein PSEBR_m1080 [Pseudomonas brassicacearum subsp. brassicacearum NFM421]AOS42474.1 hypothetical protein A0U95_28070 [Pseudomonas brassicacearum]KAB0524603.1 hypothetical protein F7R20_17925 [Pseudomonas brassicacearum subsp. brassicacearum]NJP62927.1 hypothetical protein [Pseudomonas brassicacearum]QEO79436.1 hypothetical protein ELZ14_18410 [Pseudomonas brassicacearum]
MDHLYLLFKARAATTLAIIGSHEVEAHLNGCVKCPARLRAAWAEDHADLGHENILWYIRSPSVKELRHIFRLLKVARGGREGVRLIRIFLRQVPL